MKSRKGMSQTLALIVAASVLMMAALTLIMMTGSSLGDFGSQTTSNTCFSTIDAKCGATQQKNIDAPSPCTTEEGGLIQPAENEGYSLNNNGKVSCSN